MNVAIYARVSSDNERDINDKSIPQQVKECQALAKAKNYEVVDVIKEPNRSGRAWPTGEKLIEDDFLTAGYLKNKSEKYTTRDGLAKVFELMRTGQIEGILIREITRVYRPVT